MIEIFNSIMQVFAEYLNKFIDSTFGTYDPAKKSFIKKPREKKGTVAASEPKKKLSGFVRKPNWKDKSEGANRRK